MIRANIIENAFRFTSLPDRYYTDKIIIHHTGSANDTDLSAAQINEMHKANGWVGIGYHFVIRKDGTIERGRPVNSVGAHCLGQNLVSVGIHVSGNFDIVKPTAAQIEMTSMLIANLCADYDLPIDDESIFGHRDFDYTACPGNNLYDEIPTIIGKANYYANYEEAANMKLRIESDAPIDVDRIKKVMDIFKESQCPEESLSNTFDDFTSYAAGVVKFGNGKSYVELVNVVPRIR